MTVTLALDATSTCSNPKLQMVVHKEGFLLDPVSIEYQIFDVRTPSNEANPVQIYPEAVGNKQSVNLADCPTGAKLGTGRFVAAFDPSSLTTTPSRGKHILRWFVVKETGDSELTYEEPFELLAAGATDADAYATVDDMRREGVESVSVSRLIEALRLGRKYIDRTTGRCFKPRYLDFHLDGRDGIYLFLDDPIIAIEDIVLETPLVTTPPVLTTSYRVYNRHISEGLLSPDDRDNPKVQITYVNSTETYQIVRWPKGSQNVHVTGVFGYTDPDGTPLGETPREIRHINKLLALRELPHLMDKQERDLWARDWRITQERTRYQSVTYGVVRGRAQSAAYGYFTGDPAIDTVLAAYSRPPALGAV